MRPIHKSIVIVLLLIIFIIFLSHVPALTVWSFVWVAGRMEANIYGTAALGIAGFVLGFLIPLISVVLFFDMLEKPKDSVIQTYIDFTKRWEAEYKESKLKEIEKQKEELETKSVSSWLTK